MECTCFPNNGPMMTPQPHYIPGYAGYVPQFKYKFGNTYGCQTNRIFMDPCVNMSPRAVLTDTCGDCCPGGFYQRATGQRYGNCGCDCNSSTPKSCGQEVRAPRFQSIMNHCYSPYCNRFCTRTFEQDQWRDKLFSQEQAALDGWRFCCKSSSWERPERTKPWDGDNAEFRRTQTTQLPPIIKADLDIKLRGCGCGPGGQRRCPQKPFSVGDYKEKAAGPRSTCTICDLHQRAIKCQTQKAKDAGLLTCLKPPLCPGIAASLMQDVFCEDNETLRKLNKDQMGPFPSNVMDGVLEELGELPIVTLHKLAQKRENFSGKYYPEERGLARVCNPIGGSYLTARPYRCNGVYKCCEPMGSTYAGK